VKNPYQRLCTGKRKQLAEFAWQKLKTLGHGDLPGWLEAIENLPHGDGVADLDRDAPRLASLYENPDSLRRNLACLHPWRKGPLELAGIRIDTEWRSDWKWNRLQPHLDLKGHEILDIGCGNGYFGYRMLGAGAKQVVGIDPTVVFVMQWLAMNKLAPGLQNFVLPMGIEDLPHDTASFDSVFSMGVLYHRRQPIEHLRLMKKLTRPGGQLVLETLVFEGDGEQVLEPEGRYARMRNVHAIPTIAVLQNWLQEAGLAAGKILDVSNTSTDEQRSTEWMSFESLDKCLDPENPSLSIEGYPAPVRAALLIQTG
jgi:tRNA (mo5U34)-methyltransferase